MDDIYQNIVKVALPYFSDNDTWDKVAQNANSDRILKLDALIISERVLDAREYCEKGIKIFHETYGDSIKGNARQILTYFKTRRDLIA